MSSIRHPVFARMYAFFSAKLDEKLGVVDHRRELLDGLQGRVLEAGCGNGLNFAHYPVAVTEVVAVEPEPYLRAKAVEAARNAPVPVRVLEGRAERLPVPDGGFDAAVASLMLCSVADQRRALAELARAVRPGGELRFYEHVLAQEPRLARFQRIADKTLWPLFAGGCHVSRDTPAAIEAAGFSIEEMRRFDFDGGVMAMPAKPHALGRARRA